LQALRPNKASFFSIKKSTQLTIGRGGRAPWPPFGYAPAATTTFRWMLDRSYLVAICNCLIQKPRQGQKNHI